MARHLALLLVLFGVLVCPSVTNAEEHRRPLNGPPAPKVYAPWSVESKPHVKLGGTFLVHGGGQLFDYLTTKAFEARGIPEGNAAVATIGLTWVKVGVGVVLVGMDVLLQKIAPELVNPLRVVAGSLYLGVATYNGLAR
jgi:hypothetical protein